MIVREWSKGWLLGCLVLLLAACDRGGPRFEEGSSVAIPPDRVPIILLPGVSREVARDLKGGSLVPFSALALRTDAEALAQLGDPRFSAAGGQPAEVSGSLDRALRGTDVRGFQPLIDHLIHHEGYFFEGTRKSRATRTIPRTPKVAGWIGGGRPPSLWSIMTGVGMWPRAPASWRSGWPGSAC